MIIVLETAVMVTSPIPNSEVFYSFLFGLEFSFAVSGNVFISSFFSTTKYCVI